MSGVLREGPRVVAHCHAVTRCVTPASYTRVRGGRETAIAHFRAKPPGSAVVPASCVGRTEEQDVLVAVDTLADQLYCAPDPRNYALFDHPLDHIPGMVLFDAGIQAARMRADDPQLQLTHLAATFPVFTEWDVPCHMAISSPSTTRESGRFCVSFTQSNCLTAQLDIATAHGW